MQAVTLAAVATLSSPAAVDALVARARVRSALLPVLQLTARIDALIGVVAFGLVLAILHRGRRRARGPAAHRHGMGRHQPGGRGGQRRAVPPLPGPPEAGTEAGAASRLFVALAGAIVVASGASYYLNLSPLYTNLVLGFILANSGGSHRDVTRLLLATERPVYLALLVFAGAAWSPESVDLLFLAPAFVARPARGQILRRSGRGRARGAAGAPDPSAGSRPAGPGRTRASRSRSTTPRFDPDLQSAPHPQRHAALGSPVRDRRRPGRGQPGGESRHGRSPAADEVRVCMIRRLVVLALLVGGAVLLEPLRAPTEGVIAPRSLFLFGILLLTADTFGALAHDARTPASRGLPPGRSRAGSVGHGASCRPVCWKTSAMMKRLAVGLIGLLAGAELRLADLRHAPPPNPVDSDAPGRGGAAGGLGDRCFWPTLGAVPRRIWRPRALLAVALLFSATLTVNCPMVTLAMLTETGAEGPLARTTLGVVLVADVVVILIFTAAFSLAQASLGGATAGAGAGPAAASARGAGVDLCRRSSSAGW